MYTGNWSVWFVPFVWSFPWCRFLFVYEEAVGKWQNTKWPNDKEVLVWSCPADKMSIYSLHLGWRASDGILLHLIITSLACTRSNNIIVVHSFSLCGAVVIFQQISHFLLVGQQVLNASRLCLPILVWHTLDIIWQPVQAVGCRFIFLTGLNFKNYLIDLDMGIYGYFELGLISLYGMWENSPGSEIMAVNLNQEETERGSKLQWGWM